jgi:hypothetical protein
VKDLKLEQELTLLRSLISEAKALRDIVQATIMTEVVVPEHESRFDALRESLPQRAKEFRQAVGLPEDDAAEKLFDKISELPATIRLTDLDKRKFYDRWHRYYMSLYAVQGRLKLRRERVDALNPATLALKRFLLNPFVLLIVIGAVALLVLALV